MLAKSQFVEFSYKCFLPRSLVWNFPLQGLVGIRGGRYTGRGEYSFSQEKKWAFVTTWLLTGSYFHTG